MEHQPPRPESERSTDARYPISRVILGVIAVLALLTVIAVVMRCTGPATEAPTTAPDVRSNAPAPDSTTPPANSTTPSAPSQRPPN